MAKAEVGTRVICPRCGEVATIIHIKDEWPEPYEATIRCRDCSGNDLVVWTPPTFVDTLRIIEPESEPHQRKFDFAIEERPWRRRK